MNIKDFFSSAKSQSDKIVSLEANLSDIESKYSALVAEHETTVKALTEANSNISEFQKMLTDYETSLKEAKAVETSAAVKAVQIVKTVGIDPLAISANATSTNDPDDLQKQLANITDLHERQAFFNKNKASFLK